ncbi:MAG: NAD(P)-dependent oxidoreductase [Solirubrobacterales bacterium]
MRVLVVGDSYITTEVFEGGLMRLSGAHELSYVQLDEGERLSASRPPERTIREYIGTPEQVREHLDGAEILLIHGAPVTDAVLDGSDVLRLVGCARGGPVNVDVEAASARSIPIVNTPGKNAAAVAELTLGLMIMLARRLPEGQRAAAQGRFGSTFEGAEFAGVELGGRSLGVIGYGQVGRQVVPRALACGMEVLVHDPFVEIGTCSGVEQIAELQELVPRSDFVSLHARASPDNEALFGPAEFAAMRPGSLFVNMARETLVDEEALERALRDGPVGGAALDVVHARPGREPHPLLSHGNVVITPHVGGATAETLARGVAMLADEVERFAAGLPLRNVINLKAISS